jgi:hypothetical protein
MYFSLETNIVYKSLRSTSLETNLPYKYAGKADVVLGTYQILR